MSSSHSSAFLLHLATTGARGVGPTEGGRGPARPSQKAPESKEVQGTKACLREDKVMRVGVRRTCGARDCFGAHRPVSRMRGLWSHVRRVPCLVRCPATTILKRVIILNTDPAFSFLTEPHILGSGSWVLRWPGSLSR